MNPERPIRKLPKNIGIKKFTSRSPSPRTGAISFEGNVNIAARTISDVTMEESRPWAKGKGKKKDSLADLFKNNEKSDP